MILKNTVLGLIQTLHGPALPNPLGFELYDKPRSNYEKILYNLKIYLVYGKVQGIWKRTPT